MASTELIEFFASLTGEDSLAALISQKTTEGLYLEFKTKKDRSKPELDDSDSWQFSRALSGFANSDGGVMLWGIESNKNDEAARLKPVAQVADFHARLKKSLLNSTQPVVDGVLLEILSTVTNAAEGYVKCLVPSSEKTPHRAMLANREYFKRTTEGFYRLEHFDLEDMFGRRPHPLLSIHVSLCAHPADDTMEELRFSMQNTGRGIAKYSGFMCKLGSAVQVAGVTGNIRNASDLNEGAPHVAYQDDSIVLHPNNFRYYVGTAIIKRANKGQQLTATLNWYCEGMQARSAIVTVQPY